MKLTLDNIDLGRKNTWNVVAVESQYDAAMSDAKRSEERDPVAYNANELRRTIRSSNRYTIAANVARMLGWLRRDFTPAQVATMVASVPADLRAKCAQHGATL